MVEYGEEQKNDPSELGGSLSLKLSPAINEDGDNDDLRKEGGEIDNFAASSRIETIEEAKGDKFIKIKNVKSLVLSENEKILYISMWNGDIKIWNLESEFEEKHFNKRIENSEAPTEVNL